MGPAWTARSEASFFGVDFALLIGFGVLPVIVCAYFFFKDRHRLTPTDFFLGDGRDNSMLVGTSLAAAYLSPWLLLSHTGHIFGRGFMPTLRGFGVFFGLQAASIFVVKVLKPLGLGSPNEYLWHRFRSPALGVLGSGLSVLSTCALAGLGVAASSQAVSMTTGHRLPSGPILLASSGVAAFCAALGGLRGVMWCSAFQTPLLFVVMAIITGFAVVRAGGFSVAIATSTQFGRLHEINLSLDPRLTLSLPGLLLFGILSWASHAVLPVSIQRTAAVRTPCAAHRVFLLSSTMCLLLFWLSSVSGLAMFAFYAARGCDPTRVGWTASDALIMPYFIGDQVDSPGMLGLYSAALLSTGLANLTAALCGAASALWHDIFAPFCCVRASERVTNLMPKVLVVACGAVAAAAGYAGCEVSWRHLEGLGAISNCLLAPYLALFCLGLCFPQANSLGAAVGAVAGLACGFTCNFLNELDPAPTSTPPATNVSLCFQPLRNVTQEQPVGNWTQTPFYRFSEPWAFSAGVLVTVTVGLLASACVRSKPDVERRYLWRPFCTSCSGRRSCCCCVPKRNQMPRPAPPLTLGSEDQLTEL